MRRRARQLVSVRRQRGWADPAPGRTGESRAWPKASMEAFPDHRWDPEVPGSGKERQLYEAFWPIGFQNVVIRSRFESKASTLRGISEGQVHEVPKITSVCRS